ncbi:YkvA family protein [Spirillospora albida]|uniref:YkvA family protein n=1 Tax=Spirillospora albida TaxID=58123 RepID=UPI0004C05C4E|nr:YkvA family protein [Spirillospora albida]
MDKKRSAAAAGQAWAIYSETQRPGAPGFWERFRAVPRMMKAVLGGRYKGMSVRTLGLLGLGLVYIVSPIDGIPDMLPIAGLVDDTGIALWLFAVLVRSAGDFVAWERSARPTVIVGEPVS